jgi:mannitol-1-phosphate/altronate dehydrogenase
MALNAGVKGKNGSMGEPRTFVGFGFGAIQSGLFVYEAWRSGNFDRLVVAEVVPQVIAAIRGHGGKYGLNVATPGGIEHHLVGPVEILNPAIEDDRLRLIEAIADATELATALPSVKFYGDGQPGDVVDILATGLSRKEKKAGPPAVFYTGENHNHAAEILTHLLAKRLPGESAAARVQVLNTVIGKMSGVVTDARQIAQQSLLPMAPDIERAFLVEAFNRILITKIDLPGFHRGIRVFEEKNDLLPFEEAKLYGHNATHALIGYLLRSRGGAYMSEAAGYPELLDLARDAFLLESGGALCRKYKGLDPLFTEPGYRAYVLDLLVRMTNPHLCDAVDRITRDTRRKLGWEDRLIGTMRLALGQGICPERYAKGAAAAIRQLAREEASSPERLLEELWAEHAGRDEARRIRALITGAL